jgi:alginate O-acetyltransferase complex protein AlgI
VFLFFLVLGVYLGGIYIAKSTSDNARKLALFIIVLVTILIVIKYDGPLLGLIFSSSGTLSQKYLIPLGISYIIVKLIAYVLDIYRGTIEHPDLDELLAFIFFLPIFPAGPIVRYQDFAGGRTSEFNWDFYVEGLRRIAIGYFKKVVLVDFILNEILLKGLLPHVLVNNVSLDLPAWKIVWFLFLSLLYGYIDLSAYADIAIGYGRLFGYKINENMNWPILQKNMGDYWNSWHITLSHWCRDNVYFPVLGKTRNIALALYCSFITMGMWHDISINWLLWGLWHATGVTAYMRWDGYKRRHKKLKGILPKRVSAAIGIVATVLYASGSFAFIMTDNPIEAFRLFLAMVF